MRLLLVWCVLLALAIGNGAFRETVFVPRFGAQIGHALSTVSLCGLILLAVWLLFPWVDIGSRSDAIKAGLFWLGLTVAFEFLAGHYLFKKPWQVLLADYDLSAGRVWIAVLVTTFLAPLVAGLIRGAFIRPGR